MPATSPSPSTAPTTSTTAPVRAGPPRISALSAHLDELFADATKVYIQQAGDAIVVAPAPSGSTPLAAGGRVVLADGSLVAFPADLPRCTVAARLGDYVVLTSIAGAGTDTRMLDVATRSWSALPFAIKPTEPIAMATIGGRLVFNQPLRRSGDPPEVPNSS